MGNKNEEDTKKGEVGDDGKFPEPEYKGCGPCRVKVDDRPITDAERRVVDVFWLLLFAVFWVGGIIIAAIGFKEGNPLTLIFGLDYDGHVCNRNNVTSHFNLVGFTNRYWLNPNQVLGSSGAGFNLADAASICLAECPPLMPNNTLSWVCKYPKDADGTINVNQTAVPDLATWKAMSYNYVQYLNSSQMYSSCQMNGPCYPVLTTQKSTLNTCMMQTMHNLPLNTQAVAGLQGCFSCCQTPSQAICNQTDSSGLPLYYNYNGSTNTPNGYVNCLSSCQATHGNIDALTGAETGSILPSAYLQFQTTCAAATGFPAARVPPPAQPDVGAQVTAQLVGSKKSTAERMVGSVLVSWRALVVCGLFLPILFSFVFLIMLKYTAGPIVYTIVVLANVFCVACTIYAFAKAGMVPGAPSLAGIVSSKDGTLSFNATAARLAANATQAALQNASATNQAYINQTQALSFNSSSSAYASLQDVQQNAKLQMYYLGCFASGMTVIVLIATIIMVPRLRVAIATIKVACDTMKGVPSMLLFPLWNAAWMILFMVWWVTVGLFVYSSGQIVQRNCCGEVQAAFKELYPNLPNTSNIPQVPGAPPVPQLPPSCGSIHCGYTVVMDKPLQYTLIYHGFEFLWTTQYMLAFGILSLSHAAVSYYNHVGAGMDMPRFPVLRGMHNSFRYYAGSIALGSLLVAVVQAARIALAYIQEKTKHLQETNKLLKYLMMCLDCFLACLQKLVEMINKNAYILIAIDGKSFVPSAGQAIKLLVANAGRLGTVAVMSNVVLLMGKIVVACASAFFCFCYLDKYLKEGSAASPLLPVIIVFLSAFMIASIFFSVVEMCIDTCIIAFCDDCDKHGGNPKYSPAALMDAMGVQQTFLKELEEKKKKAGGCCTKPAADDVEKAGGELPPTKVDV